MISPFIIFSLSATSLPDFITSIFALASSEILFIAYGVVGFSLSEVIIFIKSSRSTSITALFKFSISFAFFSNAFFEASKAFLASSAILSLFVI